VFDDSLCSLVCSVGERVGFGGMGETARSGVGEANRLAMRLPALTPGAGEVEVARLNGLGTGRESFFEVEWEARGGRDDFR
jgi:hypothetical protein